MQFKNKLNECTGYLWDCSDWIPASHVPLPNITEVPGSEVSSYNSNDSNDSGTQNNSGEL